MHTLTVVKIGGHVIDRPESMSRFLTHFAQIAGHKILVHGGGATASAMLERLGIPVTMLEGRRITDDETLKVCTMAYAGWVNKTMVAQLQARHCNAIGLSGADGNSIVATRRPPLPRDYGHVGDVAPAGVNTALLHELADSGATPVFCAITHDAKGHLLNTNADALAAAVATALAERYATKLIFCFEKEGVLADPNDDRSLVATLTHDEFRQMKAAGTVAGGMIPKLQHAFAALAAGVAEVHIKQADHLLAAQGTMLTL
jgi:acetylglutamate kinase